MSRYGITLPLPFVPLPRHREILGELADLGYTDAWTGEYAGVDAFTPLVLAAAWGSPSLRLGTAVVPVYTRGPAVIAQTGAALAELAPGRVVLGIGSSGAQLVTGMNGIAMDEPYRRVRDTLRFLRHAYEHGRVAGRFDTFTIEDFELGRPAQIPPQLMVGALRTGMLRLGFREGAGAITNFLTAEDISTVIRGLGADRDRGELVARIFVCPTEDLDYARESGRRMLTHLFTRPTYGAFHEWLGRGDQVEQVRKHVAAGDLRRAGEAISDDVVDGVLVHGSPERCREQIQLYVEAGVDTPVLMIQSTPELFAGGPEAVVQVVRDLAPPR
ncbi:LLM class F420-dependent oxidoreductase [Nocardia sp. BSTN01]|uniref:LLM class F420-dependent oxidoreductase n=1 Tax=Nocardia sp. BSTN01 TaxID=2783665 RepID=UPI00188FAB9E|nr:LLM class F420-dependent oxidoreductase [Nocardia sp. BSTN01]MBF5000629.1 LLM class F420-dependent oxidoreductase [Nocardia sp. BSTN01]